MPDNLTHPDKPAQPLAIVFRNGEPPPDDDLPPAADGDHLAQWVFFANKRMALLEKRALALENLLTRQRLRVVDGDQ